MQAEKLHSSHTLPQGTVLSDNYIVDGVLGEGGFGITYSGKNKASGEKIAIKEYFPAGLATREYREQIPYVSHFRGQSENSFKKGLARFLREADTLKSFQGLSNIVAVQDVFEENGTAYFVMDFIEGVTLKHFIAENGTLTFDETLKLLKPVMESLIRIHKKGLVHRDISPDNLMLGIDNILHLIDFGAVSDENPNESKTVTVILKSGYAPPEQYLNDGKIGTWTDVYGICATMYMMITGNAPDESVRRIQKDNLKPLYPDYDIEKWQSDALLRGLSLNVSDRYKNMEKLYDALTVSPGLKDEDTVIPKELSDKESRRVKKLAKKKTAERRKILIGVLFIPVVLFFGVFAGKNIYTGIYENQKKEPVNAEGDGENLINPDDEIMTMVDVVGEPLEQAKAMLSSLDASIVVETVDEYDEKVRAGTVMGQSIAENTQFTEGRISKIVLTVSKGVKPEDRQDNNDNKAVTNNSSAENGEGKATTNQGYTVKEKETDSNSSSKDKGSPSDENGKYTTIHLD